MNRALRRATAKAERLAASRHHRQPKADPDNIRLVAMPWKIQQVFDPIERVIARLEIDGTIDAYRGRAVFKEDGSGGWYEMAPAIEGVAEFHRLAAQRHGWEINLTPLDRMANKLKLDSPITPRDIDDAKSCIDTLKRLAATLKLGEAKAMLRDVKIGWEIEQALEKAA